MTTFTNNELMLIDMLVGHEYSTGNGDLGPYRLMLETGDFENLDRESLTWWWPDELALDLGWSPQKLGGVVASLLEKGAVSLCLESAASKARGSDDSVVITSGEALMAWAEWTNRLTD